MCATREGGFYTTPGAPPATDSHRRPRSAKNGEFSIFRGTWTYLICGVRRVALRRGDIIRPLYST